MNGAPPGQPLLSVPDEAPGIPVLAASGPVLLFGGCYSNLQATRALLAEARRLGIPASRTVCTGDVVAYGADAAATVALVRDAGIHVVMGNCEEALGTSAADCGCGFAEGSACDRLSEAWYRHADASLGAEARAWMRGLPRRIDLLIAGRRLAIVHGSPERISAFVFAATPDDEVERQLALAGTDGVAGGHCGVPFSRVLGGRLWHNAGAVGMPANDGTARGWFSVLRPEGRHLRVEHLPLDYDHAAPAAAMRAAALPEPYAAALATGLWPSCDVLPPAELAQRGRRLEPGALTWPGAAAATWPARPAAAAARPKFSDPEVTATGERRATVSLAGLKTLWFNTGTLCNVTCTGCYIESSPQNDRLAYLSRAEVRDYLREAAGRHPELEEVAFTGGEPFMNRGLPGMIEDSLEAGYRVLVLTNAMRPMQRFKSALLGLRQHRPDRLTLRVSLDHYEAAKHEALRGARTWQPAITGLLWLRDHGFHLAVAGRKLWPEDEGSLRRGYAGLFASLGLELDAEDPEALVLFPEMDPRAEVPEITESCWGILGKRPGDVMCASSRMVVRRKGADRPAVVACTLLPYEPEFELGATLVEAVKPVRLNHRVCAEFCVLGGASCSRPG